MLLVAIEPLHLTSVRIDADERAVSRLRDPDQPVAVDGKPVGTTTRLRDDAALALGAELRNA